MTINVKNSNFKLSNFAHYYQLEDKNAFYHSLLFEIVFLDKQFSYVAELLQRGLTLNEISLSFADYKTTKVQDLINKLITANMLCKDEDDESLLNNLKENFLGNPKINVMYLLLTDKCNFRCKYCFIEQSIPADQTNKFMSKETAKSSIELFGKLANQTFSPSITFYGGEPLLNKEIFKYSLEYIHQMKEKKQLPPKTRIAVITNGSCVTQEIIDLVKKYNVAISISLDGPQEIHDSVRLSSKNEGTFLVAIDALLRLKKSGINPSVSCTIGNHNVNDLENVNEWLVEELGITGIGYNLPHSTPAFPNNQEITKIASEKLTQIYKSNRNKGVYEDRIMRKVKSFVNKKVHAFDCAGCGQQLVISPEGKVGVCHAYLGSNQYFVGHINNLHEFDPSQNSTFIEWSNRSPLNIELCLTCPALGICGGGCPANADFIKGSIWEIDSDFCTHSLKTLEWIIKDLNNQLSEVGIGVETN